MIRWILILLAVCLLPALAHGQEWLYRQSAEITWDAPADAQPGDQYEVWRQELPRGTPELMATVDAPPLAVEVGRTDGSPWTWAVRLVRTEADGTIRYSAFTWADVEGAPTPWLMWYRDASLPEAPANPSPQD